MLHQLMLHLVAVAWFRPMLLLGLTHFILDHNGLVLSKHSLAHFLRLRVCLLRHQEGRVVLPTDGRLQGNVHCLVSKAGEVHDLL